MRAVSYGMGKYGPRREKTCLRWFAINTGADQPAHLRSLISALLFAYWKVSYQDLLLASLYSLGDWFESHFVGNPEDRFCRNEAHIYLHIR